MFLLRSAKLLLLLLPLLVAATPPVSVPASENLAAAIAKAVENAGNSRAQAILTGLHVGDENRDIQLLATSAFDETSTFTACDDSCAAEPVNTNGIQILTSSYSEEGTFTTILAVNTKTGETTGLIQTNANGKIYDVSQAPGRGKTMVTVESAPFDPPEWTSIPDHREVPDENLRNLVQQQQNRTIEDALDALNKAYSKQGLRLGRETTHHRKLYYTDSGIENLYAFQASLQIEIDNQFVLDAGGTMDAAVAYVDLLVSGANMVFEKEVDTHLHVLDITLTNRYDAITNTGDALTVLKTAYETDNWTPGAALHHALIGRNLGGGIAYVGAVCNQGFGFGVSGSLSGTSYGGGCKSTTVHTRDCENFLSFQTNLFSLFHISTLQTKLSGISLFSCMKLGTTSVRGTRTRILPTIRMLIPATTKTVVQ